MRHSVEQIEKYHRDGFLILPDFVYSISCDRSRQRAEELVHEFDPCGLISIFSTREQSRLTDQYFLESANDIRFFFEEDAFNSNGQLKQEKEKSINKIGHALHELDPEFSSFSRAPAIRE